jgi:hypothetical protein
VFDELLDTFGLDIRKENTRLDRYVVRNNMAASGMPSRIAACHYHDSMHVIESPIFFASGL